MATWVLLSTWLVAAVQLHALHTDSDLSQAIADSIKSDRFIVSLKHLKPKKKHHSLEVDSLLSVNESSGAFFNLKFDYASDKVLLVTEAEKLTFPLSSVRQNEYVKTLILMIEQGKSTGTATLYANCQYVGKQKLAKTIRHIFDGKSSDDLYVVREKKYVLDIDADAELSEVLSRFHCHTSNVTSNMQADDADRLALERALNVRGDIPIYHDCDDNLLIKTINELISVVKRLQGDLEIQRIETQSLRHILEQCNFCRPGAESQTKVTCSSHPSPCYPGVECRDSSEGPRCGRCPHGYVGDGYSCKPGTTCDQRPCFPGVRCYDTVEGFQCGSCPHGYVGNGQDCKPRTGCDTRPCSPGVHCQDIGEPPYYRCGTCPDGLTGNGTNCQDIDECDLAEPCDYRVTCTNLNPGYRCGHCPQGFTGSAGLSGVGLEEAVRNRQRCYDIDECQDNNGGCTHNSVCVNTEGSYTCGSCKPGFTGNQSVGCHIMPGLCPDGTRCDQNAECQRSAGARYVCKCKIGWAGDGRLCGRDRDLDGWPDEDLGCSQKRCRKVEQYRETHRRFLCQDRIC